MLSWPCFRRPVLLPSPSRLHGLHPDTATAHRLLHDCLRGGDRRRSRRNRGHAGSSVLPWHHPRRRLSLLLLLLLRRREVLGQRKLAVHVKPVAQDSMQETAAAIRAGGEHTVPFSPVPSIHTSNLSFVVFVFVFFQRGPSVLEEFPQPLCLFLERMEGRLGTLGLLLA